MSCLSKTPCSGPPQRLHLTVFVGDVTDAGPEILNQAFERSTFGHRASVHAHITDQGQLWGILQPRAFAHPRH